MDFILSIIPEANAGPRARIFIDVIDSLMRGMFNIVNMVMRLADSSLSPAAIYGHQSCL